MGGYIVSPLFRTWTSGRSFLTSGEYWTFVLRGGLFANEVKIVITLSERTHYQKNFFEKIFRFDTCFEQNEAFKNFLKPPLLSLEPPFWWSRYWQAIRDVKDINSGTEKGDFMHACFPYIPFFKTPVLLHPSTTQLRACFTFKELLQFVNWKNVSRTPHAGLKRHSSLTFSWGFRERTKTNGVPKWRQIWTFRETSKKSRCVQIETFFIASRSSLYFQLKKSWFYFGSAVCLCTGSINLGSTSVYPLIHGQ